MAMSFRFGTVGAPMGTPSRPGGSQGAIQFSRSIGLAAFEMAWVQSVRVSEATCAIIRAERDNQDIGLSVHAPYFINLNATREEWPKSRKRLMDAAHFGNLAGASDIIFHPGSYFGLEPKAVLKLAIPRLRACVKELRDAGNPATLRPETMGKSAMLGSLEDTLAMAGEIEGVVPCIDFAHLHARPGDGSMNTEAEWSKVLSAYSRALGKKSLRHLHIHLSGIEYGPKGEREHLELKDADLDIAALFRALNAYGCGGRILCESPIMEKDALKMKDLWLKNSGETAD